MHIKSYFVQYWTTGSFCLYCDDYSSILNKS